MSARRKRCTGIISDILEHCKIEGDTAAYTAYVLDNDGRLDEFADIMKRGFVEETVKRLLRSKRLPGHANVPAFPSIKVKTGQLNPDGTPEEKRVFRSAQMMLFDQNDVDGWHQSIDSYVRRAESNGRIANAMTKVGGMYLNGFQRSLPFPDLDDGDQEAVAG